MFSAFYVLIYCDDGEFDKAKKFETIDECINFINNTFVEVTTIIPFAGGAK